MDLIANRIIEEKWHQWCRLGNCTTNGRLTFIDCQKLFIESLARDGEVVRHVKSEFRVWLSDRVLEADHLDETKVTILKRVVIKLKWALS